MLTHLAIKNFTIIEHLELEFNAGMTVITGETGAGKSIIIDALALALGERADTQAIRQGNERCEIHASFNITAIPAAKTWMSDHELEAQDECILRRIIMSDGRSRSFINGTPSPLTLTRELGLLLIDIHGQHEHQALLKRDHQRLLLDAYAGNLSLCKIVTSFYQQWQTAQEKLKQLQAQTSTQQARQELISYQLQEFNTLALQENEVTALHTEQKQLANVEQFLGSAQVALQCLAEHEEYNSLSLLERAKTALSTDPMLTNSLANSLLLIENAIIQTHEAVSELQHYLDKLEINPERLAWVENRLQRIHDLARKHQVAPEQLSLFESKLQEELQGMESAPQHIQQLENHIKELGQSYHEAATKLTKSRTTAAAKLTTEINASIKKLGMRDAQFAIQFNQFEHYSSFGNEQIEFMVSTNLGQPLQPLNKIVSGGELSRLSLAIHVATSKQHVTPTLIFDEVDVGVGGNVAAIIGQLLRTLAKNTQVFCVTHLPQVAAYGHQHFKVDKHSDKQITSVKIGRLTPEEKIQEIARMLGGVKITEQTLAHAREMVEVD